MSGLSSIPGRTKNISMKPAASSTHSRAPNTVGVKRKKRVSATLADEASANKLHKLLTSSKSKLTTIDIFEILSYENFVSLSQEAQERLSLLMPPTAFSSFSAELPASYTVKPDSAFRSTNVDAPQVNHDPATLSASVFSSSAFRAAATTFQDHLYSAWMTAPSQSRVDQFKQGIQDGTSHAQWKDEAWYEEALPQKQRSSLPQNDLSSIAKLTLIKEGDLLVYKRTFYPSGITLEKDLLVRSIDPKSNALDLLLQPGSSKFLPSDLLRMVPSAPRPPTLNMESILSSSELEEAILEVDGRVMRSDVYAEITSAPSNTDGNMATHSARTAKAVTVWRWPEEMADDVEVQMMRPRGGRERLATVYFLRNA